MDRPQRSSILTLTLIFSNPFRSSVLMVTRSLTTMWLIYTLFFDQHLYSSHFKLSQFSCSSIWLTTLFSPGHALSMMLHVLSSALHGLIKYCTCRFEQHLCKFVRITFLTFLMHTGWCNRQRLAVRKQGVDCIHFRANTVSINPSFSLQLWVKY